MGGESEASEAGGSSTRLRALIGLAVLGTLLVGGLVFARLGELERIVLLMLEWAREAGPAGQLVMVGAYIVCVVAMLPSFPLTIAAGAIWGTLHGALLVLPVATAGCTLAFVCGRYLFRGVVEARVSKDARFAAVDRATRDQGLLLVTLMRLSPMFPYNVLNYSLGITQVSLGAYVLGSALGMVPVTFMWAHIGATAGELTASSQGAAADDPGVMAVRVLSVLATIAVMVLVTRIGRRALASTVVEGSQRVGQDKS